MNSQIQDKLRRLYRETERAIEPAANHIAEENIPIEWLTLRNEILKRDVEVNEAICDLIDSILDDIADPNRSDSFSELDEEIIEEGWNVIANNPELFYEAKYEKKVRSEIEWLDPFVDEAQEQMGKRIERVLSDEETKKKYRDRLTDMAESNRQRKNPFNSRGLDKTEFNHIPNYLK